MRTLRCRSSMLCIFSSFSARRIERNSVDKEGSCVRVDRIVPPGKPSFHRFRLEKSSTFRILAEAYLFFFDTTRARSPSSDHSSGRSHVNRRRSFDIVLLKLSPRGHHLRQSHQQRRSLQPRSTPLIFRVSSPYYRFTHFRTATQTHILPRHPSSTPHHSPALPAPVLRSDLRQFLIWPIY
jgi:hypothetical protein